MRNSKFVIALACTIVGLFLLQAFPIPGVFLMLLGTGFWTGSLVHVLILSLPSIGSNRRMVQFLTLVPICLYSSYYLAVFVQAKLIAKYKTEVVAADVGKVLDFDPTRQNLVVAFNDYNAVDRYDIPAIYHEKEGTISGYMASFLAPADQCSGLKGENCGYAAGVLTRPADADVCRIYVDHAPSLKRVTLSEHTATTFWDRFFGIKRTSIDVDVDGKTVGSLKDLAVGRLPRLPILFAGCGLVDSTSSWVCRVDFVRTAEYYPPSPVSSVEAMSELLGIRRRDMDRLKDFKGYPENEELLRASHVPAQEAQRSCHEYRRHRDDWRQSRSIDPRPR